MSSGSNAGPANAPIPSAGSPAMSGVNVPDRGIVEIGTKDRLCGRKQFGRQRRLPPAHHLRVEPRGLQRFGPAGTLAADQDVAVVDPHGAVRRDLQAAIERAPDHLGVDADAVGRGQDRR